MKRVEARDDVERVIAVGQVLEIAEPEVALRGPLSGNLEELPRRVDAAHVGAGVGR